MSNSNRTTKLSAKSDTQLIELALDQAADKAARQAASELFGRYRERVYRWCLSRVHNHDQALDLAQDVLLNAFKQLHTFDKRAQFSTWLFAITRNRCLNVLRCPQLLGDENELYVLPDPHPHPDLEFEQREEEELMLQLIQDNLPELDRQVLWLRCFEKVPVDVITKILEIKEASGARAVLQRARRKLRTVINAQSDKGRDAGV